MEDESSHSTHSYANASVGMLVRLSQSIGHPRNEMKAFPTRTIRYEQMYGITIAYNTVKMYDCNKLHPLFQNSDTHETFPIDVFQLNLRAYELPCESQEIK